MKLIKTTTYAASLVMAMSLWCSSGFGELKTYSHIAKQAIQGVVNIRTQGKVKKSKTRDLYEYFLNGRMPRMDTTSSLGSGVILDRDGHIVTNFHVINGASKIEVLFAKGGRKASAQVLGVDKKTDLALLKVKGGRGLYPLDLGDSSRLEIGDIVLAIGNPFGFSHTVTSGIISAKGRVIGAGPYDDFLQTDAAISPGNSGGPLIDMRGRVIGINTAVSEQGYGIGFAIPSNSVRKIVHDLKRHGKVVRPWLGVVGKNILSREELDLSAGDSSLSGVIVTNLVVDGPAHKAGLRIGDLILAIGSASVEDLNKLQLVLTNYNSRDTVRLKVYRRSKANLYLNVALSTKPKDQTLPKDDGLF